MNMCGTSPAHQRSKNGEEKMENNAAKRKKKQNNFIKAAVLTVGIIIVVVALLYIFRHPLIDLFFKPDAPDNSNSFNTVKPDDGSNVDLSETKSENVYNFFIVGHDRAANLTDVSMLVSFNVHECTASIMQLPRDTYVNYDNYWYHKINGVYSYYLANEHSDEKYNSEEYENKTADEILYEKEYNAMEKYAKFVENNLCVKIHYFGIMDLDQFANIVDALGGVDMYVPFDMNYYDPTANFRINLHEGQQTLDGKMSEQFVRYRATFSQGDIGRGNVQKLFMAALFKTVQSKLNLLNMNEVCSIIVDNLVTNLKATDLVFFASKANTVRLEYVKFMTLPGGSFAGADDGLSYYSLNREATIEFINNHFNIYTTPVTDEMFDPDNIFWNSSYIYSLPADQIESTLYDAESLTNGTQQPST